VIARLGTLAEAISERELAEYEALSWLDDWGGEIRHAELLAAIHNLGMHVLAAGGAKVKNTDFKSASDFLAKETPRRKNMKAEQVKALSAMVRTNGH